MFYLTSEFFTLGLKASVCCMNFTKELVAGNGSWDSLDSVLVIDFSTQNKTKQTHKTHSFWWSNIIDMKWILRANVNEWFPELSTAYDYDDV